MSHQDVEAIVATTQAYYDGPADEIYRTIWGDNLHLGVPCCDDCPHPEAMENTNAIMAEAVALTPQTRVLDLGCGYGSTARYLAANFGCHVTGTNISEKELELARARGQDAGLDRLLSFEYGDFHSLPYPDDSYDVVWSQEAFLHAADKNAVLSECRRVLKPDGVLIFTDILVRHDTPDAARARIYDRVKSPDMWDLPDYRSALAALELTVTREEDWSQHVARSYGWVRDRLQEQREASAAPHRRRDYRQHRRRALFLGGLGQRRVHRLGPAGGQALRLANRTKATKASDPVLRPASDKNQRSKEYMRQNDEIIVPKDLYKEQYSTEFVGRWDELIDWQRRADAENNFFQNILKEHGAETVLDIACGTGFHVVTLAADGFEVTGADGAPNMLVQARENAERFGMDDVRLVEAEWTRLTDAFAGERFDAVICLGNAFTHLFEESDRVRALNQVYSLLNEDGIAIIDQRNYDAILDNGFHSKHQSYYMGEMVEVNPEELTEEILKMRYEYADGDVHFLTLCPIRQNYVTALLKDAGFSSVERYGDFVPGYDFYEPDFVIQVAKK